MLIPHAMLETAMAIMKGSYEMQAGDGSQCDADIDIFVISTPEVLH